MLESRKYNVIEIDRKNSTQSDLVRRASPDNNTFGVISGVQTTENNDNKVNQNDIFKELIKNQINDIPSPLKLNISDIKRICKYINNSIFDKNTCCIWNGYVTNANNKTKGTYINFYFRNKKVALHRLLYSNFIGPLSDDEYIKFTCDHKGICCTLSHLEKNQYIKNTISKNKEISQKNASPNKKKIIVIGEVESDELILDFN